MACNDVLPIILASLLLVMGAMLICFTVSGVISHIIKKKDKKK